MSDLIPRRTVDPRQELPALELQVLERWRAKGVFAESLRRRAGSPVRVFYEGPPTANGRPGSHHVLTRVFKDLYLRYMTMRGYRVERKGGWDCHGLPVEIAVEQDLGFSSKAEIEQYGIEQFNSRCRQLVAAYRKDWERLTERIGFWLDLEQAYQTMDEQYIESVWWALRGIHDRGHLYEGHKVLPYCTRCGTPLSSHEVALGYRDVVDTSVYARLPVREAQAPLQAGDELLVWTTMVWTLPVNAAVAANPGLVYVRARREGSEQPPLVVAEPLVERVLGEDAQVLDRFPGQALDGVRYEPPFEHFSAADHGPRGHTVLLADYVTDDDGTGLVHVVPAFGEEDFQLGTEHDFAVINPVRADGLYEERMGALAGRHVREVADELIGDLRDRGRLWQAVDYEHSYPHCWRCDTPLLYYATRSWFLATSKIRERLVDGNGIVAWHPAHIRAGRFGDWLQNNVDWAISRDRFWGTPLPIWRCSAGHMRVVGSFNELEQLSGRALADHHRPYVDEVEFTCAHVTGDGPCGETMRRVREVVDVWFDSGAMPFAQCHFPFEGRDVFAEQLPADFLCEAQDQTRGWFYSLLAIAMLLFDATPYRKVLCLGLIVDAEGQKMSKSRGNTIEPWEVTNTYGADAFRWYFFTSKHPWDGYRFAADSIGEAVRLFLMPLWRTYSFYAMYAYANAQALHEASASNGARPAAAHRDTRSVEDELDAWILSRTTAAAELVQGCLDAYDAHAAGRAIAELVDELSNWYVRCSRRRFWDGDPRAFATLRTCLLTMSRLLAPFCPFIADEMYDNLRGPDDSVHLCDFPVASELAAREPQLDDAMAFAREIVRLGLRLRNQEKIKVRQPLAEVVAAIDGCDGAAVERLQPVVCAELNVKRLTLVPSAERMPDGAQSNGNRRDYAVEREGTCAVALRLTIDEELRREGLMREIVRVVQRGRKSAGLEVEARIELSIEGDDVLLATARHYREHIAGETLATTIRFGDDDGDDGDSCTQIDHCERGEIEGMALAAALRRVSVGEPSVLAAAGRAGG
jgi:isoleucyl-tRNA synthetase